MTIIAASGSSLNFKEKLFISLSWMAKASVQVNKIIFIITYSYKCSILSRFLFLLFIMLILCNYHVKKYLLLEFNFYFEKY